MKDLRTVSPSLGCGVARAPFCECETAPRLSLGPTVIGPPFYFLRVLTKARDKWTAVPCPFTSQKPFKFRKESNHERRKKEKFHPFGLSWPLCLGFIIIVAAGVMTGSLSTDLAGGFAFMLALGIICNEIGERIPFWNSYIGGGLVLTFLVSAYLFTNKMVPAKYAKAVGMVMDQADFLSFFIVFLICGSILGLEKKLLLKSFAGYLPAIFGGLIGAAVLGVAGGLVFGIAPDMILLNYVLPIMGGGNTLIRTGLDIEAEKNDAIPSIKEMGGAFFMGVGFYAAGRLMGKAILPKVFGVAIHPFAWMIIIVTIAAMTGIVPNATKAAAKRLQSFMSSCLVLIIMVGVGADTDLNQLIDAINLSNVVIAFLIVVGAIIGSAIVGQLVGFYPIDSAITAGLCMANRGGSGDLAVLGASHRMGLIAYAQLSSRLGGGIVLII